MKDQLLDWTKDELIKLIDQQKEQIDQLRKLLQRFDDKQGAPSPKLSRDFEVSPYGHPDSIQFLYDEFEKRKQQQPKYSLRSFAKDIGLTANRLSEVLSGKRHLTQNMLNKIRENINMSEDTFSFLTKAIQFENQDRKKSKEQIKEIVSSLQKGSKGAPQAPSQTFNVINKWYHLAILKALLLEGIPKTRGSLAEILELEEQEIDEALTTLEKLDLIKIEKFDFIETEEQHLIHLIAPDFFHTGPDNEDALMMKELSLDIMKKGMETFEDLPVVLDDAEDFKACLAVDKSRITTARQMINKYLYHVSNYLEGGKKEELYFLSAELFPVQKK